MRGKVYLAALVALLLGAGCSDDSTKPPADAGPADAPISEAGGDTTIADLYAGDFSVTTPGCTPACAGGEVCSEGACVKPGPTKVCGSDPFGAGLPASGVLYVDANHGGPFLGTKQNPYKTIAAALAAGSAATPDAGIPDAGAADAGASTPDAGSAGAAIIAVATGIYKEELTIDKSVELRCRCAEKVRIAGTIQVVPASSAQVLIDGCEIAPEKQTQKPADWGACNISSRTACKQPSDCKAPETCDPKTLECVHPQAGLDRGIWVKTGSFHGVDLLVRDSVISGWCSGIRFNADVTSSSSLCVSRTRLWGNHIGLDLENAPSAAMATMPTECSGITEAVAATLSRLEQNEYAGVFSWSRARGVALRANRVAETGRLQTATGIKTSTAEGGFGVYLGNTSSAHLDSNLVEDNEHVGLGMINAEAFKETNLDIRRNVFRGNAGAGVTLQQLQASKPVQIIDNRVASTRALAGWKGGDGVQVIVSHGTSYAVTVKGNVVQASKRHGLILDGVSGSVETNQVAGSGGYGVYLQRAPQVNVGTNTFGGNGQGNVNKVTTAVELCGVLPLPLP